MSGPEVNLFDAYEKIQSDKVHDRSNGLSDLKLILGNSKHTRGLNDKGYHKMFEAIFRAVVKEKMIYARQNKPSLVKSVGSRLSLCASVFRLAVEQGVVHIRNKTFKALSKHVIDILPQGDGLCEPISLDYIKALRTCLACSPHAEHIDKKEWATLARFCCTHVESQLGLLIGDPESADEDTSAASRAVRLSLSRDTSSASRRSQPPSQGIPKLNHDSEELVLCLEILLKTPNAPIVEHDEMVVRTILGFLVSQPAVTRAHLPAFTALNTVLEVITTNNISLTAKVAQGIVPVLAKLWDSKQPTFREQMMITLIYILPQVRTMISEGQSRVLRRKVEALSEALFVECSGRADRDQLQLDDLVFPDPLKTFDAEITPLGLQGFCLRKGNQRAEMNWIVPQLMATVVNILDRPGGDQAGSNGKAPEVDRNKRLKVSKNFEELMRNSRSMITSRKLCALQTLPFLVGQRDMESEELSSVLLDLFNACSDDNPVVSSWALLSIASCAFLKSASDPSHRPIWNQVWQLCARYSANQATCRAACHLMRIVLAVDLVPYTEISKEVDAMILSIDLSGPANVVDSSLAAWCLILEKRNTVAHSSVLQPGERLLQWLVSKWRPVDALERGTALFYSQHLCPKNLSSFLLSCCGKKPLDFEAYPPQSCGPIGQAVLKVSRHARLLSFLLFGDEIVPADTEANAARANTLRDARPTAHPGVELQVIEFLDRQCDAVRERWQTMIATQLQYITPDIVQNLIGFICTASILCSVVRPCTRDRVKVEALEKKLETLNRDALGYVERDECGAKQVEGLVRCVAGVVPRPGVIVTSSYNASEVFAGQFGRALAAMSQVFEEKNVVKSSIDLTEDGVDMMDLDDGFDMPDSDRTVKRLDFARESIQAACATETFQYCTTGLLSLFALSTKHHSSDELCGHFVDYLMGIPKERLIMSRPLLRDFLLAASDRLADSDAANLTEHLAMALLQDYSTERCETAVQLCIDTLSALVPRWATEGAQGDVVANCESIYEWVTKVALDRALMSSIVRTQMACLLQRILEINPEYGQKSEMKSARTQFIGLLADADVRVSFELGNCVSVLFKIFGLTVHETVFKDILGHLTDQSDWTEGLAMRVYTLAQLAFTTFSTKKLIVYHIFETGQLINGEKYAAKALSSVAKALELGGHRDLFKIFSPQLLYTWIDNDELTRFPFRVFGYEGLKELFADVQEDLVAQLLMKEKDDASQELAKILDISYDDLLEKGFHKILAYGVAGAMATPPKADAPRHPNVELRIRQQLGDEEYKRLLEKKFALIIASLFQVMQEDGTSDRFLSKDPSLAATAARMRDIVEISHSTGKIPDPLRPYFKVKVVLNAVHRLCGQLQYDDTRLWTPAMFTFVTRRLFDTMDPALGSLSACAAVRKIRLLVCLANPRSIDGYALEMVIHGLKPYIVDVYCAEDAVGVVQYLLDQGKGYLSTRPAFVIGTFLSILASLRVFLSTATGHEDTQMQLSLNIAQSFHIWLGDYLTDCHFPELNESQNELFQAIVKSAMGFRLHGNASSGTKESDLLRHLLDDDGSKNRLLDDISRGLAFSLVCSDFQKPVSFRDDIFGSDEESVARSRVLLRTCRRLDISDEFLLWVARVLGRSYATSGGIHNEWTQETELEKITDLDTKQYDLDIIPKAGIFQRLRKLLFTDDRLVIGLAEATLETIFFDESRSTGVATFHHILDENLYKAMKWSALPMSLSEEENPRPIASIAKPEILLVDEWVKNLAAAMSTNLQEDAVVKNLRPILEKVDGLAKDLFPLVVHILLLHHIKGGDRLKMELSQLFRDCFRTCTEKTVPHNIILIKAVLYLRTQETAVQEATKLPRDHWLDVDYLEMARAACTCKMFKTSLLFAEIHHSESGNAEFPDSELLLEIFRNVDDLDSYYGVNQASRLETVLKRFEYEEDGWKSLSFRGANLESHLRLGSTSDGQDLFGVVDAFNTLGMNGLSHAFLQSGTAADASEDTLDNMFRSAWKLEQWDLPCPSSCATRSATIYRALQSVNNNVDMRATPSQLDSSFFDVMCHITAGKQTGHSLGASMRTLAMLTEMEEVLVSRETEELEQVWERLQNRNSWMHIGRYSDVEEIMAMRQTILSSVAKRDHLRRAVGVDTKTARFLEAKALVASCEMARSHKVLQHSLSAATQLSRAVESCKQVGLDIGAVATLQAANVLWDHGQGIASIRMLQALGFDSALGQQSIVVGKAELLAKLGNWVSEARLEKPDKIMSNYLVTAIDELKENYSGPEAGRVFHEFASFCDQQLQNPGNIEDYQRALKLRQNKEAEVRELEKLMKSATGGKLDQLTNYKHKAKTWLNLDDAEFNRLKSNREAFLERSISNYLRALAACDDYDHDAVRFCALWLEHSGDVKVNKAAQAPLGQVASRKFVPLMNQLSSRLLESPEDIFQSLLFPLILRICMDHPHHGHYQILALTRAKPKDNISQARQASAAKIATRLKADPSSKPLFNHIIQVTTAYMKLATQKVEKKPNTKPLLRGVLTRDVYSKFAVDIPSWKIPPPTMQVEVRADRDYSGLSVIVKFHPEITIASGISAPKIVTCLASDGCTFKMLFKGGNDDLRQDAIMEQVFEQVSNLLKKSRTTRQRNLSIRNYKVLPLAHNAGIIEFVANTIPLYEFLMPAHMSYHPRDLKPPYCRKAINDVQTKTREVRINTFQRVAAQFKPVMRYFFMHKFNGPDDWFSSRLAYSRSTAAISILGHVLGLGDRHGHNILLDEKSGEVVHIDLGVAFEQGRILPVPEVVPFRLTRDIIDGFGITRTEGVFRRSCEFTLTVLRNEAYNIITILDVLRYDPLYSWTISPLRMKKMQDQVEAAATGIMGEGIVGAGGGKKDEESEADRALTVVAKKLSATLSVGATVNELIQVAGDERNLAVLYSGWAAYA